MLYDGPFAGFQSNSFSITLGHGEELNRFGDPIFKVTIGHKLPNITQI